MNLVVYTTMLTTAIIGFLICAFTQQLEWALTNAVMSVQCWRYVFVALQKYKKLKQKLARLERELKHCKRKSEITGSKL